MRVRLNIDHGQVVDFVVQLEVAIDPSRGIHLPAVRFDATHGRAHVDYLTPAGELARKTWLPAELTFSEAATYAISETKAHWQLWRTQFLLQIKDS